MKLLDRALNKGGDEEQQQGINMVDLMMWLVIAALLLAAALQGIGYYQKNAYVYQMKEAANVAASRTMALSATDGSVDPDDADAVVAEENAATPNDQITLTVETIDLSAAGSNDYGFELSSFATATTVRAGETFYLRASHEKVGGHDVVHFFKDTANKKSGTHLVNKGTTDSATPGGTPTSESSASPSPSATATASPSATATTEPAPSPTPTPTPTSTEPPRPANSDDGVIVNSTNYPHHNEDKTVHAGGSDVAVHIGFKINGAVGSDYDVKFTGGASVNTAASQSTHFISGSSDWYAHIQPNAGGYTEGVDYITATVTHKGTGNVSTRHWKLTVTPALGLQNSVDYVHHNGDKNGTTGGSNQKHPFGFMIKNSQTRDYIVKWTGAENINGSQNSHAGFAGQDDWYTHFSANAGGFTTGTGVITGTATNVATGVVYTRTFNLTITEGPGMVDSVGYTHHNGDKTGTSGSGKDRHAFGFLIRDSLDQDYRVTFTGGAAINAATTQNATRVPNSNGEWYTHFAPAAGGFTVGTDVITATATNVKTGKVFTRTFNLTITEGAGMVSSTAYTHHNTDKTIKAGATNAEAFGFMIPNANVGDYDVTFTGGEAVGAKTPYAVGFVSNTSDWYIHAAPVAGGWQVGEATITATAKNKASGKTYTKTFKITVVP